MSNRTLLGLMVTAAVMGAILYFGAGKEPQPLHPRRLLAGMSAGQISRLELRRGAEAFTLRREGEQWRIEEPVQDLADGAVVQRMLTVLEFAEWQRLLPAGSELRPLGLSPPELVARVCCAGGQWRKLELGRLDPSQQGVYLKLPGGALAVAASDLRSALNLDLHALRQSLLLKGALGRVMRLALSGAQQLEMVRDGGSWRLSSGERKGRASTDQLARLLALLGSLRASRFVAGGALRAPSGEIRLKLEQQPEVRLQWGGPCPGHVEERLVARVAQKSEVRACMAQEQLATLEKIARQPFWATRLSDASVAQIEEASLRGQRHGELQLKREAGQWRLSGAIADQQQVQQWLGELLALPLSVPLSQAPPPAEAELVLKGDELELKLSLGRDRAGWLGWREGENPVRIQGKSEVLRPELRRFKNRRPLRVNRYLISRLKLQRGEQREELRRGEQGWQVEEPLQAAADTQRVERLVGLLAELRAERWLDKAPTRGVQHLRVGVERESLQEQQRAVEWQELSLSRAGAGCQARAAGGWFETDPQLCEAALPLLVTRAVCPFDGASLLGLRLERGGWSADLVRRQQSWFQSGASAPLDAAVISGLLQSLRQLKGEPEAYLQRAPRLKGRTVITLEQVGGSLVKVVVDGKRVLRFETEKGVRYGVKEEQLKELGERLAALKALTPPG